MRTPSGEFGWLDSLPSAGELGDWSSQGGTGTSEDRAKTPVCATCGSHSWSKHSMFMVTRDWIYGPDGAFELDQEDEDFGQTEWTCANCHRVPKDPVIDVLELL